MEMEVSFSSLCARAHVRSPRPNSADGFLRMLTRSCGWCSVRCGFKRHHVLAKVFYLSTAQSHTRSLVQCSCILITRPSHNGHVITSESWRLESKGQVRAAARSSGKQRWAAANSARAAMLTFTASARPDGTEWAAEWKEHVRTEVVKENCHKLPLYSSIDVLSSQSPTDHWL